MTAHRQSEWRDLVPACEERPRDPAQEGTEAASCGRLSQGSPAKARASSPGVLGRLQKAWPANGAGVEELGESLRCLVREPD